MRLLIADDHALFRDTLVQYIERTNQDAVLMLARDLHEVMEIMEGAPDLDLILLDFKMPGMNGLSGLANLKQRYPLQRVALLSGAAEEQHVREAIELGICAYFPKTMSGKNLMKAIARVMEGEIFIAMDHNSQTVMPAYYDGGFGNRAASPSILPRTGDVRLTPREQQVLVYLLKGCSNKEIARMLDLQIVTVKLHVRGVCRKLEAKNRTQAALRAQEMGLGL